MISRILTVLEQWASPGVALGEAGWCWVWKGWKCPQGAENQHQTNTSVPIRLNKQLIQVVVSLSRYFLQITSYQHAPKSPFSFGGATWEGACSQAEYMSGLHKRQRKSSKSSLVHVFIREVSQSTVTVLVTHIRHRFLPQTIHCFLYDNWSTGKEHNRARCEIWQFC